MKKAIFMNWLFLVFAASWSAADYSESLNEAQLWNALQSSNHFALIRHALAPGTGDPSNFEVTRRDTQRNLSETGRMQAVAIGDRFREQGIAQADVRSSQWFRCLDTAELLNLGEVRALPALNSFFQNFAERDGRTAALRQFVSEHQYDKPLVLVTHQVNITALTGVYPSSGEIVFVRIEPSSEMKVIGTIKTL